MGRHRSIVCGAAMLCAFAAPAGPSGERPQTASTRSAPETLGDISQLATARRLARYGLERRSPEALAVAAEMLLELGVTRRVLEKIEKPRRDPAGGSPDEARAEATAATLDEGFDAAAIVARARSMAAGDPVALHLVERVEGRLEERPRGRTGGTWVHCDRIRPGHVDRYELRFDGGELAEIWVEGSGATDLDCFVFAPDGSVLDARTDHLDSCLLVWRPGETEGFALEIDNLGSAENAYCLATN